MNSNKIEQVPVIDLFAGPGGLSEGFSSVLDEDNKRCFKIKLSIEKDACAYRTLLLRAFCRQFPPGSLPPEYYQTAEANTVKERYERIDKLFETYPDIYQSAKDEVWKCELGSEKNPPPVVDEKIRNALGGVKDWVLIGGPPCQVYSLVGRSRVGGIDKKDQRVYLYKEYLRIIAVHHPLIFVMENVKGLLSAKVNGKKVFSLIMKDLKNPSLVFKGIHSPKYRIYSLTAKAASFDQKKNPRYNSDRDYLIESEKFGVPQKRHRVILLGIREDIDIIPDIIVNSDPAAAAVKLKDIIGDLPKIRSGINRSFVSSETINGRKKRTYRNEPDSDEIWQVLINSFRKEIISWNGFAKDYKDNDIIFPIKGIGSEFVSCETPPTENPLSKWCLDPQIKGACNHESRSHLVQDLKRYMFSSMYAKTYNRFPRLQEYNKHSNELLPDHKNAESGKFSDRFRVQLPDEPATTVTSHISKDGHYFIHYDPDQCRSLTVREAARIQTFPDNYLFCGSRTAQYHQVGNAVPPYLAFQVAKIVLKIFREI